MFPSDPTVPAPTFKIPLPLEIAADAAKVFEILSALNLSNDEADYEPAGVFKHETDALAAYPSVRQRGPRKRLLGMALEAAGLTSSNAQDHLRALAHDAARQPAPVWTPLTLARVVLEAMLLGCYLLDPSITLELRLARVAALDITEAEHQIKAAKTFPAPVPAVEKHLEKALQRCAKAGAQVHRNAKGKIVGVSVDGHRAPMDINLTEATTHYLRPGLPSTYRLTSGAAHSRPWMIASSGVDSRRTDSGWAAEAATMMTAVMTVTFAVEAFIKNWCAYFGLDPEPALRDLEKRQRWFLNRAVRHAHGQPDEPPAEGRDFVSSLVGKHLSES